MSGAQPSPGQSSRRARYHPGVAATEGRRTRSDRVRENDRRLRTALEEIIVETGWGSVTVTGVAKRAGLTVGAVYARAESPASSYSSGKCRP